MPSLEEILHKVVLADSEQISQGTVELREAFKSPDIIPSLCQVMGTSQQLQIRQYCAVLLRKRLSRKRNWLQLSTDVRRGIQVGIIHAMIGEPERTVRNSMAQVMGVVVKHLKSVNDLWPELLTFLQATTLSNDLKEQELGTLALAGIAEMGTDALALHLSILCQMFKHVLENSVDLTSNSVFNTITCMKLFSPELKTQKNCNNVYCALVPTVLQAVSAMAPIDPDKACQELELIEILLGESVALLHPHISSIITMCLQLAANNALDLTVRNKAMLLTGWIAGKKKKIFLKLDLLRPTVTTIFQVMCEPYNELDDDEDFASAPEVSSPKKVAAQAIDSLAMCLPPDKFMPLLAEYVEPAIQGDDPNKKRAAYLVLAVVVEGCNAYVRTHCLEPFVLCISKGITDSALPVRNSALYALGQFSDHLQPEINKFAPQLVPVLISYLDQLCATLTSTSEEPAGIDRMFYALETFIENLEDDLNPYFPALMDHLLRVLDLNTTATSPHLRQLALSAIGAAAQPAKLAMLPYFPTVIEVLKMYLTQPATSKDLVDLQTQSLDTLGLLARGLGPEHVMQLARESLQLGLTLVKGSQEEADIRKASYGMFAAMSTILKEDMENELRDIIPCLIHSIKSNDGIVVHFKEDTENALPVFEDDPEVPAEEDINEVSSDSEEDACSELEGYLKNSYTEEKEEALMALKEIASSQGEKFNPYLQESISEVLVSLSYPDEDVKTAALGCITQLFINLHRIQTIEAVQELRDCLLFLIPKVAELVECDCSHSVVMACMELFATLLKELKNLVVQGQGHKEAIINCIKDTLIGEIGCQYQEDLPANPGAAGEDSENGGESEQDEMLFQYTADVLAPLGNALPCDDFAVVFKKLLPVMISKSKKGCNNAVRAFATGMLAECMAPLGPTQLPSFVNQLFPLLLKLSYDDENDVRSNAIYALGELAKHGKESVFPRYSSILATLSAVLKKENGDHLLDNVCGAIARLIVANVKAVPLDQVLPVFLQQLPLRSDFEEAQNIVECISYLYQLGCPQLVELLDRVVFVLADLIKNNKASKETCGMVVDLLRSVQRDFPVKFEAGVALLAPADVECFKLFYSSF